MNNFFSSDKDRDDTFIAFGVILFFILFLWMTALRDKSKPVAYEIRKAVTHSANILTGKSEIDRDSDGIADSLDLCPDVYGLKMFSGCPKDHKKASSLALANIDSDGDGFLDAIDSCRFIAGPNHGCPDDTDGDGIYDIKDKCPEHAGLKENRGCPDSDNDGVIDLEDKCPLLKGEITLGGCPKDTDGDGIYDINDPCPLVAGDDNGCPEIKMEEKERKVIEEAVHAVQFDYGKATLKSDSKQILAKIADILRAHPDYKLDIEGHTDSKSSSEWNMTLSTNRAKSCVDHLVSLGIDRQRMNFKGYGESRPIESNDTEEGRRLNRRVEFKLHY